MKKFLILFLMVSTVLSACKKDDPEPSKKEMITKSWTPSEVSVDGERVSEEQEEFWKSMTLELRDDNTYLFQTPFGDETGTWSFNGDETKLNIDGEEGYEILELTSEKLRTIHYEDGEKWDITWR